jgi:hypothetical protein
LPFAVLHDWNSRCDPPWTDRELQEKIASARRYGHEDLGFDRHAQPRLPAEMFWPVRQKM